MPADKKSKVLLGILKEEGLDSVYLGGRSHSGSLTAMPPQTSSYVQSAGSGGSKERLLKLRELVMPCTKCPELARTRTQVVFGSGNANAKLMLVGEAPGADEDEQGVPFVGRSGQLLTKIIESIGYSRDEVFIANVLKCRPPANRQPAQEEIANCTPYLKAQIEIIQPRIVCALGTFAGQYLLQTTVPISQLRGKFYDQGNYKLMCTYHPAYLLRNPGEKRAVWEDMKMIKRELEKTS